MAANVEAALAEKLLHAAKAVEEQVDQEIERLDKLDDDELEKIRQQRVDAMKKAQKQRDDWAAAGHGEYTEVANEREFFDACKRSKRVVCHFYRDGTFRSKILDKHLRLLAAKHMETKFITASVDRLKFVVERLNIRVLPTTCCILDGNTETYIRGFEGISDKDDFPTENLERRLAAARVINMPDAPPMSLHQGKATKQAQGKTVLKNIRGRKYEDSDSSDDG